MKRVPILPTLLTLGNLVCGFLSISYVLRAQTDAAQFAQHIVWAGWWIFFAMIFDALDGKVARMSSRTSDFGAELDSLCDIVSFGVAPAMIVRALAAQQHFLPRLALATSILFVVCAALRLARFNVETEETEDAHIYFKGLPTPAAAGFIAAMTIMFYGIRGETGAGREFAWLARGIEPIIDSLLYVMPYVAVVLAMLMISNIRYTHILNKLLRGQEPIHYVVNVIIVAIFVVVTKPFSMPVVVGAYVLSGIIGAIKRQFFNRVPARLAQRKDLPHSPDAR